MNLNEKLTGVVRSLPAVITPDGEEPVKLDMEFDLSGCTIEDVIELALRPRRITQQNALRYNDKLRELGSTVRIIVKPIGVREAKIVTVDAVFKDVRKLNKDAQKDLLKQIMASIEAAEATEADK
ncbi:MAG: hypothetical protein QMD92_00200 [bacterium]|nr:hypothetical protein [bacterium]